jgi:hypothetical protein
LPDYDDDDVYLKYNKTCYTIYIPCGPAKKAIKKISKIIKINDK